MNESNDNDRLFIAKCALILFIMGLLGPFLIAMFIVALSPIWTGMAGPRAAETAAPLAVGFGFLCEVLALVLGIVGRRHASGKIGIFGGLIVLIMAFVMALALVALSAVRYSGAKAETVKQMQEKAKAVRAFPPETK